MFIRKAAGTDSGEQVVAANINTVFLCMSFNNDFDIRRLERYVALSWDSGATPVVVLTKTDLCEDIEAKILEVQGIASGVDVITVEKKYAANESEYMQEKRMKYKEIAYINKQRNNKK